MLCVGGEDVGVVPRQPPGTTPPPAAKVPSPPAAACSRATGCPPPRWRAAAAQSPAACAPAAGPAGSGGRAWSGGGRAGWRMGEWGGAVKHSSRHRSFGGGAGRRIQASMQLPSAGSGLLEFRHAGPHRPRSPTRPTRPHPPRKLVRLCRHVHRHRVLLGGEGHLRWGAVSWRLAGGCAGLALPAGGSAPGTAPAGFRGGRGTAAAPHAQLVPPPQPRSRARPHLVRAQLVGNASLPLLQLASPAAPAGIAPSHQHAPHLVRAQLVDHAAVLHHRLRAHQHQVHAAGGGWGQGQGRGGKVGG